MRGGPAVDRGAFPTGFVFGAATSAYQIEGAPGADGKGPSIWDTFTRQPGRIAGGSSGEVACDGYRRYREDVTLLAGLGLDAYRFSLAWPRLQPDGRGAWSEAGFDHYARVLDALDEAGVAAFATLYHWDLPQALEDAGGWRSRDTAHRFADYAAEVGRRFGRRLRTLATFNEPWCIATLGHHRGEHAPGMRDRRVASQVAHHLLVAHGLAVRAVRAAAPGLAVGIALNQWPAYPADPGSEADRAEARLVDGLWNRWYLDPLFLAAYPVDALRHLGADAPQVSEGDLDVAASPLDFLGVNYYERRWCSAARPPAPAPAPLGVTDMGWEIYPAGLTDHLVRLARAYQPPPMYVTENGAACADAPGPDGEVSDPARVRYLALHLEAVAEALGRGADVRGYFVWSLLDNFEWAHGYTKRFGLVYVDFATQRRTVKASGRWLRDFIAAAPRARRRPRRGC